MREEKRCALERLHHRAATSSPTGPGRLRGRRTARGAEVKIGAMPRTRTCPYQNDHQQDVTDRVWHRRGRAARHPGSSPNFYLAVQGVLGADPGNAEDLHENRTPRIARAAVREASWHLPVPWFRFGFCRFRGRNFCHGANPVVVQTCIAVRRARRWAKVPLPRRSRTNR